MVVWRKSKKMNVDGVDSDSEIDEAMIDTPPDIANEALQNKTYFRKNLETCITLKMSSIKSKICISSLL
jgi:hypothetical protein